jgi:hypothetical protein
MSAAALIAACREAKMATRGELIKALYAASPPYLGFAVREACESVYVPPLTLWQRIVQVFKGPQFRARTGEVDVAVIVDRAREHEITIEVMDAFVSAAQATVAAGVRVVYTTYVN